jgi:hypothetical protein
MTAFDDGSLGLVSMEMAAGAAGDALLPLPVLPPWQLKA